MGKVPATLNPKFNFILLFFLHGNSSLDFPVCFILNLEAGSHGAQAGLNSLGSQA